METPATISEVALAAISDLSGTVLALGSAMIGVSLIFVAYKWVRRTTQG